MTCTSALTVRSACDGWTHRVFSLKDLSDTKALEGVPDFRSLCAVFFCAIVSVGEPLELEAHHFIVLGHIGYSIPQSVDRLGIRGLLAITGLAGVVSF